jgi:hypothetical protein
MARTPDDGQKDQNIRVLLPIKLELGAFVGFIHKESITTHGQTVLK